MTSPLAMLAVATPAPSRAASGTSAPDARGSRDSDDASSFSDIMARQRAGQDATSVAPAEGGQQASADTPAPIAGQDGASPGKDGATADADQKDDGKSATDANGAAATPTLAQQALAMAAMAMQLQGGPTTAAAAANGQPAAQAGTDPTLGAVGVAGTNASAGASNGAVPTSAAAGVPAGGLAVSAGTTQPGAAAQAGAQAMPATGAPTDASTINPAGTAPAKSAQASAAMHPPQAGAQDKRGTAQAADASAAMAKDMPSDADYVRDQDGARQAALAGKTIATSKDGATDPDPAAPRDIAPVSNADMTQALANAWQAPTVTANAAAATPAVRTPVGQPQWGAELGSQLVLMTHRAGDDSHTAELRLDPPDLGPLRVTIKLNDGVAEASFVSAHAAVRQAVESALPQLQQTLAQAGISLGQTSVSDHGAQAGFGGMQHGNDRHGENGSQNAQAQNDTAGETVQIAVPARRANVGLVDTFA